MKRILPFSIIIIAVLILAACGSTPLQTPSPNTVETSTATPTLPPTVESMPQVINTPTQTSNDLMKASLLDYSTAYIKAYPENKALFDNPDAIIGRLTQKNTIGADGKSYELLSDPQTQTPLFVKSQNSETGEWSWQESNPALLAKVNGMTLSASELFNQGLTNTDLIKYANETSIATELNNRIVFRDFTTTQWSAILSDWDAVSKSINNGEMPQIAGVDFPYNFQDAESYVTQAQANHISIRAPYLLGLGYDVPKSIREGGYTSEELKKILEFTVKAKVLKYKGVIKK